jgi:glc operon protein GlcG
VTPLNPGTCLQVCRAALIEGLNGDILAKELLMQLMMIRAFVFGLVLVTFSNIGLAQSPPEYGQAISLDKAKQIVAAAEAEAKKNKWSVAITVVDCAGFLVAFEKMDQTQLASIEISMQKAKTSALYRRPTKTFDEQLAKAGENLRVLKLPGVLPIEGGLPILVEGKIVGAIGVSGAKPGEDAQCAAAELESTKAK